LQCGLLRQSSHGYIRLYQKSLYAGDLPAFLLKGNRPIRRRGAGNGEIQLDLKPQGLLFLPPSVFYLFIFKVGF
jgi:hypothetical protein